MAREQGPFLDVGDAFPSMDFAAVDGNRMCLPADVAGKWTVLLFYRGDWWRYCRQQLLDFQVQSELLKKLDIQVVAASIDSLEKAEETVKGLKLKFPVGYGLDAKAVSALIGAYYDKKSLYLHATGFLLRPDGTVLNAVYSSLAVGRFGPQDVTSLVEIIRSREKN